MTYRSSKAMTSNDVIENFNTGQNIFRRKSVGVLVERVAELEAANAQLLQQLDNVRGLIPYWDRLAAEAEAHPQGKLIAAMHRGAIEAVKMALQAGAEDTSDES